MGRIGRLVHTFTHTRAPDRAAGDGAGHCTALRACADAGKTVTRRPANDNCLTSAGTVQVTPQPDLVVKKVTV